MFKRMLAVVMLVLAAGSLAVADTVRGINLDFVTIGHPGNPVDSRTGTDENGLPIARNCGAVGYEFRMGTYEITNAQWNTFVGQAGTPTGNPSDAYDQSATWTDPQQPTTEVSWYEAAQFCNYLTSGDKSKGAYGFSGNNANPGSFTGINRAAAQITYGTIYVIPTGDEWYKAAYYKPDGSGYSTYANGTNIAPVAGTDSNYGFVIDHPWNVGMGTLEQNGTKDMMGNVYEWNETLVPGSSYREIVSGSINDYGWFIRAYGVTCSDPYIEDYLLGFRVASIVPEPCGLTLLLVGGLVLRRLRK